MEDFNQSFVPPNVSFGDSEVIVSAVVLIFLCIFAVFANSITVLVILLSPKLKSPFCQLIWSLSVSDLVSSLFSLLELYRRTWGFSKWNLPNELCQILWGVKFCTMIVTSFHIVFFTIVRFLSVKNPTKFRKVSKIRVRVAIGILWFIGLLVGFLPGMLLTEVRIVDENEVSLWPSCTLKEDSRHFTEIYIVVGYIFLIYVPIILVAIFSLGIATQIVKKRRTRKIFVSKQQLSNINGACSVRMRRENQGILQLSLITGSFLLGYVPSSVYHIYSTHFHIVHHDMDYDINHSIFGFDWWLGIGVYFSLRVSECLNPIFYNIASRASVQTTTDSHYILKITLSESLDCDSTPSQPKPTQCVINDESPFARYA